MGENTKIEWADHTFNPWIGCTKVSPACDGCYAEAMMDHRYGRVQWGAPGKGNGTRERTSAGNWSKPKAWDRKAKEAGTRPFVFCSSLADVFDNQAPPAWRRDLFDLICATPNLVWLLLTKRPQNIVKLFDAISYDRGAWPKNAAIGTTVEDQHRANLNIPALVKAKNILNPAFAFLSCEPLLGSIDLEYPVGIWPKGPPMCCSGIGSSGEQSCGCMGRPTEPPLIHGIDWVITGGETDQGAHKARPSHPKWFRSLRDQCAASGVPFHMKQWGEFYIPNEVPDPDLIGPGKRFEFVPDHLQMMERVGKHRSGRLLDGVEHNARPVVEAI